MNGRHTSCRIPGFESSLLRLEIDCDFGFMFIENQSGFVYMGTTSPSLCKLVQPVMKEKSGHFVANAQHHRSVLELPPRSDH